MLWTGCWQNTDASSPEMKVTWAGFDGQTNNLAFTQGLCTRRVKPTQNSTGKSEDQIETEIAGRGLGARGGGVGGILAGTRVRPKVQEAGKGTCGHKKPKETFLTR